MYKTWGKHHSSLSITPAGLSFPSAAHRAALHWGCMAQPQHQNNASAPGELIAAGRLQPGPLGNCIPENTPENKTKTRRYLESFFALLLRCNLWSWPEKKNPLRYFFSFLFSHLYLFIPHLNLSFLFFFQISVHHLKVAVPPLPPQGTFASILLQSLSKKNTPALLPAEGADNMTAFCSLACFPSISQVSLNLITQLTRKRHTY